jgi:hypothetical protein
MHLWHKLYQISPHLATLFVTINLEALEPCPHLHPPTHAHRNSSSLRIAQSVVGKGVHAHDTTIDFSMRGVEWEMGWLAYRAWCRGILWSAVRGAIADPLHRELTETLWM